jgi:hypothetical protein
MQPATTSDITLNADICLRRNIFRFEQHRQAVGPVTAVIGRWNPRQFGVFA